MSKSSLLTTLIHQAERIEARVGNIERALTLVEENPQDPVFFIKPDVNGYNIPRDTGIARISLRALLQEALIPAEAQLAELKSAIITAENAVKKILGE